MRSVDCTFCVIRHHFTVAVEEHFQVLALAPWVALGRWELLESWVARNVDRLFELLVRHGATGTFFTLGRVGQRHATLPVHCPLAELDARLHRGDWQRLRFVHGHGATEYL